MRPRLHQRRGRGVRGPDRAGGEAVDDGPYTSAGQAIGQRQLHDRLHGQYPHDHAGHPDGDGQPGEKVYGQSDPTLAYAASGYQFSDDGATVLSGGLTRTTGEAVDGGPYTIAQGTLTAKDNYTIAFTGNTLTITPATLTVTASPESKIYGQADPTLAYTASGYQFSDDGATVLTGGLTRAAGETVEGGPYTIAQGTLTANDNYTIAFTGNTLTITPATLAVTANPESKVYGQSDPTLAYAASGYQFSDDGATVLTGGLTRAAGETVDGGPYTIAQGTLSANDNYTIVFTGNTLTITPATLTVTASPESKVYGQSDPTLAYAASGYQFSDDGATVLSGGLTRTRARQSTADPINRAGHANGQRQLHDRLHGQYAHDHPRHPDGDGQPGEQGLRPGRPDAGLRGQRLPVQRRRGHGAHGRPDPRRGRDVDGGP